MSVANDVTGGGRLRKAIVVRALPCATPHPALLGVPSPQGGGIRTHLLSSSKENITWTSRSGDSNGADLAEGDNVTLIKDLKLKGSSTVLKRGTVIRNIHLTDDPAEIEGRTDKVKGLVLRTEFLKKA